MLGFGKSNKSKQQSIRHARNLLIEPLEERTLLAVDLIAVGFSVKGPNPAYWGDEVVISEYILNRGDNGYGVSMPSGDFSVGYYASADSTITPSLDSKVFVITGGNIYDYNGYPSLTFPQRIEKDTTLLLGSQQPISEKQIQLINHIGMFVDPENKIYESGFGDAETNNWKAVSITIKSPYNVTISQGNTANRQVSFGSIVNDGVGGIVGEQTITLSNLSNTEMVIDANGVTLSDGTNFRIKSVISSKTGTSVNLANFNTLAANGQETWTITVQFDPSTTVGNLAANLQVSTVYHGYIEFALSGTATAQPKLMVVTPSGTASDPKLLFTETAFDVSAVSQRTFTLTNTGSGALTINRNGISIPQGSCFTIKSITSSTQGTINLTTAAKTIAPYGNETWTIVVEFKPVNSQNFQDVLTISSLGSGLVTEYTTVTLQGYGKTAGLLQFNDPTIQQSQRMDFGNVHANGAPNEAKSIEVQFANPGEMELVFNKNGITLANGTNFSVQSIVSNVYGEIDLSLGAAVMKSDGKETWTMKLLFDPKVAGNLTDSIVFNTNSAINSSLSVQLVGNALNTRELRVFMDNEVLGNSVTFHDTLADGVGGSTASKTYTLTNPGAQTLTINANGIRLTTGTSYRIASIVSSTRGTINLTSSQTLAAKGAETWTVTVVFDPNTVGNYTDSLIFASNSYTGTTRSVALNGKAVLPTMNMTNLNQSLNLAARTAYTFTWEDVYSGGNADIRFYYDTDRNPNNGKTQIVSGINSEGELNQYAWQIPDSLIGQTVYVYYEIADGNYTTGNYATGSITVGNIGEYRLVSAPVTTDSIYTLKYELNGVEYTSQYLLNMGTNTLYHSVVVGGQHQTRAFQVSYVASLMTSELAEFDEYGQLTSVTDASGTTTSCEYNILGQLTKLIYATGESVAFTYDASGNVVSMHDSSGWQFYEYDLLERLVSVTVSKDSVIDAADQTIRYEYDLADQLTKITYPSGLFVSYTYDTAGRLSTVKDTSGTTIYAYDSTTGLVSSVTRPNGTRTQYTFDANFVLTTIRHEKTANSSLIEQISYQFDAAGRATKITFETPGAVRAEAYSYTEYGNLEKVVYSENDAVINETTDRVVAYEYNSVGSRTKMTDKPAGGNMSSAAITLYVYGAGNRLLKTTDSAGNTLSEYFYDACGNLVMETTDGKTIQYYYNAQGLMSAYTDGENFVQYEYDGAGRRIAKIVNGERTDYVVDPSAAIYQVLEEYENGVKSASYTYGSERISATPTGAAADYYLTDHLGSIRAVSNATGTTKGYVTYDAFGKILADPAALVSSGGFGYTGEQFDAETGQMYLRARYYAPALGRFTQKDPLGFVDSFDTFVYCANDPINMIDPCGMGVEDIKSNIVDNKGLVNDVFHKQGAKPVNWAGNHVVENQVGKQVANQTGKQVAGQAGKQVAQQGGKQITARAIGGTVIEIFGAVGKVLTMPFVILIPGVYDQYLDNGPYEANNTPDNSNLYATSDGIVYDVLPRNTYTNVYSPNLYIQSSITNYVNSAPSYFDNTSILSSINDFIFPSFNTYGGANSAVSSAINNYVFSDLGGVILDKAATLVGENLSDIKGVVYDPNTGQMIFIGDEKDTQSEGVNMDFLFTAIQSVYGSVTPPYVTLDPPAMVVSDTFDAGATQKVIPANGSARLLVRYTPLTSTEEDDLTLQFRIGNQYYNFNIDGFPVNTFYYDDGTPLSLETDSRQLSAIAPGTGHSLPPGVTVSMGSQRIGEDAFTGDFDLFTFDWTPYGQEMYVIIEITNTNSYAMTFDAISLIPDLAHCGLSVQAKDTMLGWVMYEADRVMKNLAIGECTYHDENGPIAYYNSYNNSLPNGFKSLLQMFGAQNALTENATRFWFTPNEMTLQRYIDPDTGEASIIFSEASVLLQTESMMTSGTSDPVSQKFADFFNAHFDEFADIEFPVSDPTDPTGESVIYVKIFSLLRDAMKSVSIARFFHDNDIPLDTWWINSYTPQSAHTPATINTMANSDGTFNIYGGVNINAANTYMPSVVAKSIIEQVLTSRPNQQEDIGSQTWAITSTDLGNLTSISLNLSARQQSSNIVFSTTDLAFAAPGSDSLAFNRSYNSGYTADGDLGAGWSLLNYELQFQRPNWTDENGMMVNEQGQPIDFQYTTFNTGLREGEIRFVDYTTGEMLNFYSSLQVNYSLENREVSLMLTGLDEDNLPTFTPGEYANGSTLVQLANDKSYRLNRADGSSVEFAWIGKLLKTTDAKGYSIVYNYDDEEGRLTSIVSYDLSSNVLDTIWITYNAEGKISQVCGPDNSNTPLRKVEYEYSDAGLLTHVTHYVLKDNSYLNLAAIEYIYDNDGRIVSVKTPSGLTPLDSSLNIYGQKTEQTDLLGNSISYAYTKDSNGNTVTTITDVSGTTIDMYAEGLDALRYVQSVGSVSTTVDANNRTIAMTNNNGISTHYYYLGDSNSFNGVTLDREGFETITIERNSFDLPTLINNPNNPLAEAVEIEYNDAKLPVQIKNTKGVITVYTYTDFNAVATVTEALGTSLERTTTYNYNAAKLLASIVDPLGRTVASYTYDSRGRVLTYTGADAVTVEYAYDEFGRMTSSTILNYVVSYEYNEYDQIVKTTTPLGFTTSTYDAKTYQLASETDILGQTVRYVYDYSHDLDGNITGGTGALNEVRVISRTGNPSNDLVVGYVYDTHGNMVLLAMPNGDTASWQYNTNGQIVGSFEDDRCDSAVEIAVQIASDKMILSFTTSEPVVTATLYYWEAGKSESDATSVPTRVYYTNQFTLEIENPNGSSINYRLVLTDTQGNITSPNGVISSQFLAVPTELTAEISQTPGSMVLSWKQVVYSSGYEVMWRASSADTWTFIQTNGNSVTVGTLLSGGQYEYRVRAVSGSNNRNCSDWSEIASFNLDSFAQLAVPKGVTITSKNTTTIAITWDAVSNASGYVIQYTTTPNDPDRYQTSNVSTTSADITGLNPNFRYYFRVMAIGTETYRNSDYSDWKSELIPPMAPTNFTGMIQTSDSITLTWDDTHEDLTYTLLYKKSNDTNWTTWNSPVPLRSGVTVTPLDANTTYEFQLTATNASGSATSRTTAMTAVVGSPILTAEEYAMIRSQNPDLNLSTNMANYNIIVIIAEQLSDAALRNAITQAGNTAQNDLIVCRTTITQNKITLGGTELAIYNDVAAYGSVTIVSFGTEKLTIDANQQSRVFSIDELSKIAMAGLVVTNGKYNNNASGGGGIYNVGLLLITNCMISANIGAGIYNTGMLTVTNSTISANSDGSGQGGGISNNGTLMVANSIISGNTGDYTAGINGDGPSTITNCIITENTTGIGMSVGGMSIIINSTIAGNGTGINSGGFGGTLTITNCVIAGNYGVGLNLGFSGKAIVTNCTIAGNGSFGVELESNAVINNTIIVYNDQRAMSSNSDAYINYRSGTIVNNSIIGKGVSNGYPYPTSIAGDNTMIGTMDAPIDPKFVSFTPYTTWTSDLWKSWNLRLASDSPAINKGSNILILDEVGGTLLLTDLDGNTRIANTTIDMGAYEYGGTIVIISPPAIPQNFTSTAQTENSVTLSWNAQSGLISYVLQYKAHNASTWTTWTPTLGTGDSSATITGLTSSNTYQFRLTATNANGSASSITTAVTPSSWSAPTNFISTSQTENSVTLSWDAKSNATYYRVEYKKVGDINGVSQYFHEPNTTSVVITDLEANTLYKFTLWANDNSDSWVISAPVSIRVMTTRVPPLPQLPIPTLGNVTATSSNSINVTWDMVPNASGYVIQYATSSSFNSSVCSVTTTSTAINLTNLWYQSSVNSDCIYYIRVMAIGTGETKNSSYSATKSVTMPIRPPFTPENFRSTAQTANSITLAWSTHYNLTDYSLQYRVTGVSIWMTWIPAPGTSDNSATITGLTANTAYEFRLTATNTGGSAASTTTATTYIASPPVPLAPQNFTGTAGQNFISLSWDAQPYLATYKLEYKESGKSTWMTWSDPAVNDSSVRVTGLSVDKSYDFRLTATNESGSAVATTTITTNNTAPRIPSNFSLDERTSNSVTLSWDVQFGLTGYILVYKKSTDTNWTTWSPAPVVTASTATITGLTADTKYDFQLTATNASGSAYAYSMTTTYTEPLVAPQYFTGISPNTNTVTLSWVSQHSPTSQSYSNISSYTLQYRVSNTSAWTTLSPAPHSTDSTATVTGLAANTTYDFRLTAINESASVSSMTTVTTLPTASIAAPTLGNVTGTHHNEISVAWNTVTNASGYTVEYATTDTFADKKSVSATGTSTTLTGLTANTTYYVRVMATGTETYCDSDYSAVKSAKTKTKLANPTLGNVTGTHHNEISVAWNAVANASSYTVEYATTEAFTDKKSVSATGISTTLTGLTANTTYYVRVMATGTETYCDSDYSAVKSAKTHPLDGLTMPQDGISHEWTVRKSQTDNNKLEIVDLKNSSVVDSYPLDTLESLIINSSGVTDDSLTIDFSFGNFELANGIQFNGHTETFNTLYFIGTDGDDSIIFSDTSIRFNDLMVYTQNVAGLSLDANTGNDRATVYSTEYNNIFSVSDNFFVMSGGGYRLELTNFNHIESVAKGYRDKTYVYGENNSFIIMNDQYVERRGQDQFYRVWYSEQVIAINMDDTNNAIMHHGSRGYDSYIMGAGYGAVTNAIGSYYHEFFDFKNVNIYVPLIAPSISLPGRTSDASWSELNDRKIWQQNGSSVTILGDANVSFRGLDFSSEEKPQGILPTLTQALSQTEDENLTVIAQSDITTSPVWSYASSQTTIDQQIVPNMDLVSPTQLFDTNTQPATPAAVPVSIDVTQSYTITSSNAVLFTEDELLYARLAEEQYQANRKKLSEIFDDADNWLEDFEELALRELMK